MNSRTGSFSRFSVVGGALTLAGLFIFVWIIRIQTSPSAKLIRDKAEEYYTYVHKTIYPERGSIYDRWGHLLAGSKEVFELGADLRYVRDPETIAMTVSNLLGLDYKKVYASITVDFDPEFPRYVVITKNAPPDKIDELTVLTKKMADAAERAGKSQKNMPSLEGLLWTPSLQRSYPEHTLASTILGFYSFLDRETGRGYFGVEEKYNHLLAGSPVDVLVPVDPYLIDKPPSIPPGDSLILTIDREVQEMVEKEVDKAVEDNGATSGTIVIMDPRNGEIIAMASTPRMDPTEYWNYGELFPNPTPYNRAIGQTYEPGSVFKVLTMAAAIDAGVVTPDSPFLDTGIIEVGGIPIYNWDRGAWGPQTMTTCMQHSLNVCLAWVATQLGPTNFYNYLQRFGIGHMTGIDLAGEVNWPLSIAGDPNWYPVNLGTNAFGQGVATTPIQMITAISAVANRDGRIMAPHILRSVIENGEKYNNPPQVIGNPIKPETSRTVTEMLAISLEEEASDALVEGYRVAGKTGTAEIAGPEGYTGSLTNASFVGWGPADDPRFIVYIWLEKPTSSPWGSVVAAPIFSSVVSKLVVLLDLPPDDVRLNLAKH
jgi:cell division protein FtsI/penicillin-binding protein 2